MFLYKKNIFSSRKIEELWEYQYLNTILNPYFDSDIKIFIYSENDNNINEIIIFKESFKPDILIHLSDEWGIWNWQSMMYKNVKLIFRQYMFGHYPKFDNLFHIPLGFNNNFLKNKSPIKKIEERKNIWGFCGNINKENRLGIDNNILNIFEKYPHEYIIKTEPENMFNVYNNSIFMINRRGNVSLDCLRIYEACMTGCIPIVQGNYKELLNTFSFNLNKETVPFIFIENYQDFDNRMKDLLEDKILLQNMSYSCISWFNNQIKCIQDKINEVFN
jgi:hypothetical protein